MTTSIGTTIGPATPVSPPGYPKEGKWPVPEMRPGVDFRPAMPQKCAGTRMEPPSTVNIGPGALTAGGKSRMPSRWHSST